MDKLSSELISQDSKYSAQIAAVYDFLDCHSKIYNAIGHYICSYDKNHNKRNTDFEDYSNMDLAYKKRFSR